MAQGQSPVCQVGTPSSSTQAHLGGSPHALGSRSPMRLRASAGFDLESTQSNHALAPTRVSRAWTTWATMAASASVLAVRTRLPTELALSRNITMSWPCIATAIMASTMGTAVSSARKICWTLCFQPEVCAAGSTYVKPTGFAAPGAKHMPPSLGSLPAVYSASV